MSILLLVRHGQASFGRQDYDALSDLGHEQARILGRALAARGVLPDVIVRGDMRRHRETAEGILAGLAAEGHGSGPIAVDVDGGWDEFDFQHVMERHRAPDGSAVTLPAHDAGTPGAEARARFQAIFEEATARWIGGTADEDYHESFPAFDARVDAAARSAAQRPERTVLVVTSGGPIGLVASRLLTGDASLWPALNRVAVNTAMTKVLRGRTSLTLSTYNEHGHLEHDRALVTYR